MKNITNLSYTCIKVLSVNRHVFIVHTMYCCSTIIVTDFPSDAIMLYMTETRVATYVCYCRDFFTGKKLTFADTFCMKYNKKFRLSIKSNIN